MRNPIIQMLPAGASISIAIDPPMTVDERPYVLTMHGKTSPVAVEVESDKMIRVHNPMSVAVPFVFFLGPQTIPPHWMQRAMSFIAQLRKTEKPAP